MKLQQINEAQLLQEFLFSSIDDDDINEAYEELELLGDTFESGFIGLLIGKRTNRFKPNEYLQLKRKLSGIIRDNVLIDGADVSRGRDGDEKMRIISHKAGHWLEAALTGAFGAFLIPFLALTTGPIGAILGGAAIVGLLSRQNTFNKQLDKLSQLFDFVDAVSKKKNYTPRRSAIEKTVDAISLKSPKQIELESSRKIRRMKSDIDHKMKKGLGKLPDSIQIYSGSNVETIPMSEVFADL